MEWAKYPAADITKHLLRGEIGAMNLLIHFLTKFHPNETHTLKVCWSEESLPDMFSF